MTIKQAFQSRLSSRENLTDVDINNIRDKFNSENQKMYEEAKNELRLGLEFLSENLIYLWW